MSERPQVRLDPEVAAELQRRADAAEHSLATEVNAHLRRALGLGRAHHPSAEAVVAAPASIRSPARTSTSRERPFRWRVP